MYRNRRGFVVSAILYPLLILFLALIMGLLTMTDTRKRILDKMKLEISDSLFDDATCSCDTILNKLNYLIRNGLGEDGKKLVSDEFTEEKDYVKGDYVSKDNTLWKFKSDKVAGEWDESKVAATSVINEIQYLTSKSNQIMEEQNWETLANGSNLNNMLGKYRSPSTAVCSSLVNRPKNMPLGEVTVEWFPSEPNNHYGVQIIKATSGTVVGIYVRSRNNGNWGNWYTVSMSLTG